MALLVGLLLVLVPSPTSAATVESAQGGGGDAAPAEVSGRTRSDFGWGIEIRRAGLGPCSPSTPAQCYGFVYNVGCPAPGQARLNRIRTYMGAVGTEFVGFRLRAKLIPRGQAASSVPWSTPDVASFPSRPGLTERLMDVRNISGTVDATAQWDIQVEYRFNRNGGRPPIVRVRRGPEDFDC